MTETETSADPKKRKNDEVEAHDFEQLLETGRILWPTYFQLAAMTFAWNASLAAGAGFLIFQSSSGLNAGASTIGVNSGILVLAAIGIVYNIGALSAYVLMNRLQRNIIVTLRDFSEEYSKSKTATLLLGFVSPNRKQALRHLTHLFFVLLASAWTALPIVFFSK